jgi:hypothetical protein
LHVTERKVRKGKQHEHQIFSGPLHNLNELSHQTYIHTELVLLAMTNKRLLTCFAVFAIQACAFSSNYLESLTKSNDKVSKPSANYLDSLTTNRNGAIQNSDGVSDAPIEKSIRPIFDLQDVSAETPSDHYAKKNPGAGCAGYHHPMFGGYLDNLKGNIWEEGKEADYGDDVRWGAQVYLDNM